MLAAHRRWSAVAGVLEHDLQGFSQQVEAVLRGCAEGVFMVRPVAYPPDAVIRASFSASTRSPVPNRAAVVFW